jgi:hypothetical protein
MITMIDESGDLEIEDVEDALLRVGELADLTGRKKTDIVADLLDDGKLNRSAGSDSEIKKDLLDVAQEKAEKLKTLLTTLIPIFAILMGLGAEGIGLVDITGWGSGSVWDEESDNVGYGACLNPDATNYDSSAKWDDGSCDFGVPYCDTEWQYDDYSSSNENSVFVRFTFFDDNHCGVELEGHFKIILFKDNFSHDGDYIDAGVFTNDIEIQSDFNELDEGNYEYEIEFHTIECDDGTCEHGDEFNSPHKPNFIIEAEVILGCMDETANNYYELATQDDGSCEYDPEIIEGCTNSTALNYDENATVDDDSCEYPPPRCEIVLYEILMQYNNNTSWVQYDLDCGTEPNDQDGYNVSVQFWMSQNNTSLNYTIGYHYIKGYIADTQELCLENLTAGKYDFHWIAIWIDDDGEQKLLEVNWSDIEITG